MKTDDNKELEIWNEGRRELTVFSQDGGQQTIIIKKCGIGQMQKLLSSQGNEINKALIYVVGKSPDNEADTEWFENLEPDSQLDILEKGGELNDDFFTRWYDRFKKNMKRMGVDLDAEMHQTMAAFREKGLESMSATKESESHSPESSATSLPEVATQSS